MFYTICVYRTIRVWYVPYAYTHMVQPYAYGTIICTIRVWYSNPYHMRSYSYSKYYYGDGKWYEHERLYIQLALACSCSSLITQLAWSCIMHAVCIASYKPCYTVSILGPLLDSYSYFQLC